MVETAMDDLEWLPDTIPFVVVDPKFVKIIESPHEFYQTLLTLINEARERIVMSALYLGNDRLENRLVNKLLKAMDTNPNLKVSMLFDYLRSTRGGSNSSCASQLKKLVPNASIYLFHAPHLRGLKKWLLPERVNEVVGLQHMKLFVFDDDVIITGANLSRIYFTNREDRYILIKNCPELANFFDNIVETIGSCSFKLSSSGQFELEDRCSVHPFKGDLNSYEKLVRERMLDVMNEFRSSVEEMEFTKHDTRIYPLLQMHFISFNEEFEYLKKLFSSQDRNLSMMMSSGYFNPTDEYAELITNQGKYDMNIVFASPEANGFFQGSGISGFIPQMYIHISRIFFDLTRSDVRLREYNKPYWSYHAKGLWINPKSTPFFATLIGSSNFGYRSVYRDIESQFLIVTSNEKLKSKLQSESSKILQWTSSVNSSTFLRSDHFVPFWIRFFARFIRHYF